VFRWVAIGVGIITAALLGFIVAAIFLGPDFRGAWRDVFIVIFAALQLVSAVLTIALLLAVLYVVNQLNKVARTSVLPRIDETMGKVNEVLDSTRTLAGNAQQAASSAANTTGFVAERVVSPIIRVSSLITGVRAAATTLARRDDGKAGG